MPIDRPEHSVQMRKGVLTFCTLLILKDRPLYSSEIIEALKVADLIVVEGTLYPLLSRLKKAKYLTYDWQESPSGPPRKYYKLTEAGEEHLAEMSASWSDLVQSINTLIKRYG